MSEASFDVPTLLTENVERLVLDDFGSNDFRSGLEKLSRNDGLGRSCLRLPLAALS